MMLFSMRVWGVVLSVVMVAMERLSLCFESRALYTICEGLRLSIGGYASEWSANPIALRRFYVPRLLSLPESLSSDKQNFSRIGAFWPFFLPNRENRGHGVTDKAAEKNQAYHSLQLGFAEGVPLSGATGAKQPPVGNRPVADNSKL